MPAPPTAPAAPASVPAPAPREAASRRASAGSAPRARSPAAGRADQAMRASSEHPRRLAAACAAEGAGMAQRQDARPAPNAARAAQRRERPPPSARPALRRRRAEAQRLQHAQQRRRATSSPIRPAARARAARRAVRHQPEFRDEQAKGGIPASAAWPSARPQPSAGWVATSPPYPRSSGALDLRRRADGKERRGLHQRMTQRCSSPPDSPPRRQRRRRAARPICSMLAPAEQPPRIAPPPQRNAGQQQRGQAQQPIRNVPGAIAAGLRADDRLRAQDREHRRIQQQPRQHGARSASAPRHAHPAARNAAAPGPPWCRSPPAGRRRPASARPVATRATRTSAAQDRPGSPRPSTGCAARYSTIVPNSASAMPTPHRMKNFHAASIAAGVPCTRHHQHGGERRDLDRHPHHAQVVGQQRQEMRAHEDLEGGVVGAVRAWSKCFRRRRLRRRRPRWSARRGPRRHEGHVQRIGARPARARRACAEERQRDQQ